MEEEKPKAEEQKAKYGSADESQKSFSKRIGAWIDEVESSRRKRIKTATQETTEAPPPIPEKSPLRALGRKEKKTEAEY